jgi:hypothetical protein
MPQDRDQLTPEEPEDAEHLRTHRGQGTGGTGLDELGPPGGRDDEDPTREPRDPE